MDSFVLLLVEGYFSVSAAPAARISSALASKSVAVWPHQLTNDLHILLTESACGDRRRPTRIPLVTKGFSGSLGIAFLLTVMFTCPAVSPSPCRHPCLAEIHSASNGCPFH